MVEASRKGRWELGSGSASGPTQTNWFGPFASPFPLHLPQSPPSDPQPYTDELVRITSLQASIGSQPLHCDVYMYMIFNVGVGNIHPPPLDPTQTNWFGSQGIRLRPPTPTENKIVWKSPRLACSRATPNPPPSASAGRSSDTNAAIGTPVQPVHIEHDMG